ncbi:MAG: glycosyltransferase [Candidatus Omnitrophica bacterium]|nr:glycosyltransferase [Candidatus Omnitrophota bacterium]
MKVLIVYASAGSGHRRAAEAIYNYLKENRSDLNISIIDILTKTNVLFKFEYTLGYSFLLYRAVSLWRFAFWLTEFKWLRPVSRFIASLLNLINSQRFIKYLFKENPDIIISTHFLSSEIAAYLKRKKKIGSKIITVITDFGVHPFWVAEGTDLYIAASEFTKGKLLAEGVREDKIRVFGLPSDAKFLKQFDRYALAQKIGIAPDKFTVLLMTGSSGIGPLEDIARLLSEEVQVLLVCAANKKLYTRLNQEQIPQVRVFAFVDNTEELMAVSDLIITKAGGSTIAEIVNMELTPIFISIIPGQEADNVEALKEFGVGLRPKDISELRDFVLEFKNNPQKLEEARDRIRKIKKLFSCQEIASVIR